MFPLGQAVVVVTGAELLDWVPGLWEPNSLYDADLQARREEDVLLQNSQTAAQRRRWRQRYERELAQEFAGDAAGYQALLSVRAELNELLGTQLSVPEVRDLWQRAALVNQQYNPFPTVVGDGAGAELVRSQRRAAVLQVAVALYRGGQPAAVERARRLGSARLRQDRTYGPLDVEETVTPGQVGQETVVPQPRPEVSALVDPYSMTGLEMSVAYQEAAQEFEQRLVEYLAGHPGLNEMLGRMVAAAWENTDSEHRLGFGGNPWVPGAVSSDLGELDEVVWEGNLRERLAFLYQAMEQGILVQALGLQKVRHAQLRQDHGDRTDADAVREEAAERERLESEREPRSSTEHQALLQENTVRWLGTRTRPEDVRPPLSERELRFGLDSQGRLRWRPGGNIETVGLWSRFEHRSQRTGGLVITGPSGTSYEFIELATAMREVWGLDIDAGLVRLAVLYYLMVGEHHTFHEVMVSFQLANPEYTYYDNWGRYRHLPPLSVPELRQNVAVDGLFPDEHALIAAGLGEQLDLDDDDADLPVPSLGQIELTSQEHGVPRRVRYISVVVGPDDKPRQVWFDLTVNPAVAATLVVPDGFVALFAAVEDGQVMFMDQPVDAGTMMHLLGQRGLFDVSYFMMICKAADGGESSLVQAAADYADRPMVGATVDLWVSGASGTYLAGTGYLDEDGELVITDVGSLLVLTPGGQGVPVLEIPSTLPEPDTEHRPWHHLGNGITQPPAWRPFGGPLSAGDTAFGQALDAIRGSGLNGPARAQRYVERWNALASRLLDGGARGGSALVDTLEELPTLLEERSRLIEAAQTEAAHNGAEVEAGPSQVAPGTQAGTVPEESRGSTESRAGEEPGSGEQPGPVRAG
jgi:hypothetical protein